MSKFSNKATAPLKFHKVFMVMSALGIISLIGDVVEAIPYVSTAARYAYYDLMLAFAFELLYLVADIGLRAGFLIGATKWEPYAYKCLVASLILGIAGPLVSTVLFELVGADPDWLIFLVGVAMVLPLSVVYYTYYRNRKDLFDGRPYTAPVNAEAFSAPVGQSTYIPPAARPAPVAQAAHAPVPAEAKETAQTEKPLLSPEEERISDSMAKYAEKFAAESKSPAPQTPAVPTEYCTGCGTVIRSDIKFCPNCGTRRAKPLSEEQISNAFEKYKDKFQ